MLEVQSLSVQYGPVRALEGVTLAVREREVVAILGVNGAGKTSLLRAISRLVPWKAGNILLEGVDLRQRAPHEIVSRGLAHCPEGRRIFPDLTIQENLEMGAFSVRERNRIDTGLERAFRYFPILAERRRQKGGALSGGEQQMLAVARALMSSPRLLMLDEPSLGLAPRIIDQIFDILRQINREEGVTILLVEQNANEALLHADRAYILEQGRVTLEGEAEALRRDERVRKAYLGV